jgi:hypothetical protein
VVAYAMSLGIPLRHLCGQLSSKSFAEDFGPWHSSTLQ